MNLLIEGWRGINHSFALVNQWQLIYLYQTSINLFHKDVPYFKNDWNDIDNNAGFSIEENNILDKIKTPKFGEKFDLIYRISYPFNFIPVNKTKIFCFITSEFQDHIKHVAKEIVDKAKKSKDFFIITPSKWSSDGIEKQGFARNKIHIVPHGIEPKRFFYDIDIRKYYRKKLNLLDSDFVLCNVGSMTGNKGIDLILKAFVNLKKIHKNLKLILKDQSNLYQIKSNIHFREINDKEIMDSILPISSNLTLKQLNGIYNATDLYVSPYRAEGFNLTPLEAAASGTPILVSKNGSTDDYFNQILGGQIEASIHESNNYSYLEPSLLSLETSILAYINKERSHDPINASKFVHNNYSWKNCVDKLINIFKIEL